ncbi:hypothetical protein Tco_0846240 [Tanacetum coccineum]
MVKIHTDKNVADLLTKAFDGSTVTSPSDGKKIIITEASVRHDLQLNDEEGTDCLPNATIFKELTRMGAKTTTWNEFSSTMASAIICLATNQKFNFSKYIFESMVKNLDNVGKFLMYPRSRRPKRKDTEVPQPSGPTTNVADEAVYEERDDSLERAATTATGLDAEKDKGNIDKTQSKATRNEPSSLGTSSGGGPRRQETMGDIIAQTRSKNVSKLSNDPLLARVIDLENTKTTQAQEIISLKLRVKKLEKKGVSRTHKLKRLYKEDASKQGRKIDDIDKDAEIILVDETQGRYGDDIMFIVSDLAGEEVFVTEQGVPESKKNDAAQVNTAATTVSTASIILVSAISITDVEITLAQVLAELKSVKPTTATSIRSRAKGLVIHEQEQAPTPTVSSQQPSQAKIQDKGKAKMIEPEPVKKLSKKDQLKLDEEVAQNLSVDEVTLAQALAALKSAKVQDKANVVEEPSESITTTPTLTTTTTAGTTIMAKGLVIHEQEQAPTPIVSSQQPSQAKIQDKGKAKMIEPKPVKKLSKKDQLKLNEEVDQRLQAEFDDQERIEREKAEVNIALKERKLKAKIKADELLAERLQAREQEELTIEERAILFQQLLERRRKHFAAKRAEKKRNMPPIKDQQRGIMCTYLKNMEGWKTITCQNLPL